MQTELSHDDLLWLIGQKDAMLLLLARQMKTLMAENERLTMLAQQESPHAADNGQASDETVPAQTAA